MSGIVLERRNDVAPVPITGPTATNPGTVKSLGRFHRGDRLELKCRYAEAYINATTAPALRNWEGPYIRIRPAADQYAPTLPRSEGGGHTIISTQGDGTITGSGGVITPLNPLEQDFFYEFDAIGSRAIYFPWDGDVELYTAFSGIWVFDRVLTRGVPAPQAEQQFAQSRALTGTGSSRNLRIPVGAEEWSMTGSIPSVLLWYEDTGKVVGLGSTQVQVSSLNLQFLDRIPTCGARGMICTPNGVLGADSVITFWCHLR